MSGQRRLRLHDRTQSGPTLPYSIFARFLMCDRGKVEQLPWMEERHHSLALELQPAALSTNIAPGHVKFLGQTIKTRTDQLAFFFFTFKLVPDDGHCPSLSEVFESRAVLAKNVSRELPQIKHALEREMVRGDAPAPCSNDLTYSSPVCGVGCSEC